MRYVWVVAVRAGVYARHRDDLLWSLLSGGASHSPAEIVVAASGLVASGVIPQAGPQVRNAIASTIGRYLSIYRPTEGRFVGDAISADGEVAEDHLRFAWALGGSIIVDRIVPGRPWLDLSLVHVDRARAAMRRAERRYQRVFGVRIICLEEAARPLWLSGPDAPPVPLSAQWKSGGAR